MNRDSIFSCIRKHRIIPKMHVEMIKNEENEVFDGVCVNSNPMFHFKKHPSRSKAVILHIRLCELILSGCNYELYHS